MNVLVFYPQTYKEIGTNVCVCWYTLSNYGLMPDMREPIFLTDSDPVYMDISVT